MTPAMKAMVEAMAAEIAEQAQRTGPGAPFSEFDDFGPGRHMLLVDGTIDLEKVARAGLEAVRKPPTSVLGGIQDRMHDQIVDYEGLDKGSLEAWGEAIDAILKDQP